MDGLIKVYVCVVVQLRSLRRKSLLEECLGDEETKPINMDEGATTSIGGLEEMEMYSGSEVVVHDLYVDFAKLECKRGSLDKIECFAHEDCNVVPRQMKGFPSGGPCWPLKRIALMRGRLRSLSECRFGEYYKNVVVLKLEYLTALIDLNVEGMNCLASVDILCCYELRNIHGLQTLKELAWLRVARCEKVEVLPNLQDLHVLEHVEVRNTSQELCPIISNCPQLYELRLSCHYAVKDLSNIQALHGLRKVMIEWCPKLCTLPMFQDFRQLHELYVLDCLELGGVMEIGSLVALRKLHLRSTNITELGGVGLMRDLCHLICEQCPLLHKLSDKIGALTKLTLLRLSKCPKLDGVLAVGSLLALQKLHLTDIAVTEISGLGKLRCLRELLWTCAYKLRRLDIRDGNPDVTSSPISPWAIAPLELAKLINSILKRGHTTPWNEDYSRFREVMLDKCFNVDFLFDMGFDRRLNSLQNLLIENFPHYDDIDYSMVDVEFLLNQALTEMESISCPPWRG